MKFINLEMLNSIDTQGFRDRKPYPWLNPQGFLTEEGFKELSENMPDVALFEKSFKTTRNYNQTPHDRYILEYEKGLNLPEQWQTLISELNSKHYRGLIAQLMGTRHFRLRLYWHYTPKKCDVSPHCDSSLKLGSQIFYMNTAPDWNPEWGGQTVILDDNGKFDRRSNPGFNDFDREFVAETMDNRCMIFGRNGNSWHGVRAITAPEGKLRQVFIIVFEDAAPWLVIKKRIKDLKRKLLGGKPDGTKTAY